MGPGRIVHHTGECLTSRCRLMEAQGKGQQFSTELLLDVDEPASEGVLGEVELPEVGEGKDAYDQQGGQEHSGQGLLDPGLGVSLGLIDNALEERRRLGLG